MWTGRWQGGSKAHWKKASSAENEPTVLGSNAAYEMTRLQHFERSRKSRTLFELFWLFMLILTHMFKHTVHAHECTSMCMCRLEQYPPLALSALLCYDRLSQWRWSLLFLLGWQVSELSRSTWLELPLPEYRQALPCQTTGKLCHARVQTSIVTPGYRQAWSCSDPYVRTKIQPQTLKPWCW